MIDHVTVTERTAWELSKPAKELASRQLEEGSLIDEKFAAIDVNPKDDSQVPRRPFLHRGDWVDDGRGNMWTVLTSLLHEDDDNEGEPYIWHEYEVIDGMRLI